MLYPRGQTKSQARLNQDIYNISAAHQFQNLKGYDEVAAQTEVRNSENGIVPNEIAQSFPNQKVIIINLSN